jgi:hypothetical protein
MVFSLVATRFALRDGPAARGKNLFAPYPPLKRLVSPSAQAEYSLSLIRG